MSDTERPALILFNLSRQDPTYFMELLNLSCLNLAAQHYKLAFSSSLLPANCSSDRAFSVCCNIEIRQMTGQIRRFMQAKLPGPVLTMYTMVFNLARLKQVLT